MQILNLNYRRLTFRTLSNQRSYLLFFASFLLSFSFAFGQQKLDGNRPKLGLVLSGGGAWPQLDCRKTSRLTRLAAQALGQCHRDHLSFADG